MRLLLRWLAYLLLFAAPGAHANNAETGVVLLHGKWDKPPTHVSFLARQLESAGFLVAMPTMPWSDLRQYDAGYPAALAEIEAAAASLRQKGAKRVVVAGQSFGANAALAYAASGRKVDGVAALSPGHTPERGNFKKALEPSVAKARSMIESGQPDEKAWFEDRNQGKSRNMRTSAAIYLSYFDPEGIGNMQKTASDIPQGVPVFMAVGTADNLAGVAEASLFDRAPKNALSKYVAVPADHLGLVQVIDGPLIQWLQQIAR